MAEPVTMIQEPIEPIAAHERAEEEDEFETSDFDSATLSSSSTSLNTSIYQHAFENGRRYHQYRHGTYPIPNDDAEQNRDDMKHAMMLELTNGNLFFSPIVENPQKIIDLATGTGIWAIDVADKFPSASVVGVDLSPIQPSWVPPNLKFLVDDIEDEWMHGGDFDFVHMRCISPWLKDEVNVLRQAHDHMKPGAWIEIQELDARANCDDGSLAPDAPLAKFFDTAEQAVASFGMKFRAGENLREPLEKAGFTNVSCKVLKVPIGTWAKDKKLRLIGLYLKTAVSDMFGAMAAKPLRKILGPEEIEVFLADARKDLNNVNIHSYENYVKGREGLLDRKKWKDSIRLGPNGTRFHGGWYIALSGNSHWQFFWGGGNPQQNTGETMHNEPPQGDSMRLELIEEGSHGSEDTFPLSTGFMQLSTQWEQTNSNERYHITIYETALPTKVRRYIKVLEEGQERRAYITVRSKDNWKKLFLLQFHHACLRLFFDFLTALEADEKEHAVDANTDAGSAELWQWNLRTITQRSYEYRDLGEMGRKLISTTESLIDVVRASSPVVDSTTHANKFMAIDMEIRGLCRESNERIQNFSDQLDHDLKYLELARDINQTRGVQQLTLLATIFLPLSLAAGVLSMQTRFKDLGTLLYDFFGVVVLLAAIVLIILILLSLVAVVNEVDTSHTMDFLEGLSETLLHTILCGDYTPQRPLNIEDRPYIQLPVANLDSIIQILHARGQYTHEAWEKCLTTLETVKEEEAELDVFPVLDVMEDAFQEVITDLKEITNLNNEAKEDVSILLRPELDVRAIRTFRNDLIEADEILLGRGRDEQGQPIERFEGVGKLFGEVLPQLEAFLAVQNNAGVVLPMALEIIKAQRLVEEHGEGRWLQPLLKNALGEDLYQQILEAAAA
ncbi:mRNA 3 end-processing YTH1 [Fusarium pseudocircinatum]|uniref:mRNA 3 end-processing YTH1 n=1 Tax=Fusarium pseudocircinatum TaxID=56676 RepID=A0A8H5P367_9HYPO|nr:mRNA 3 end-processing YTH1 [Fusarium pseudocircinatum]